jgi:cytochrome c oxidase subunit 4
MPDLHLTPDQELEVESHAPYIKVWLALAVLTAIEYFYAKFTQSHFAALVLGLMFWATFKAGLVGWYFMHLKFEGKWVYYMLVPAGILACVLVFALMPDIALQPGTDEDDADESAVVFISAPGDPPAAPRMLLN